MAYFLASEVRMHLDSEGRTRAKHPAAAYPAWKPFVEAFGPVTILARVDREGADDSGELVDGEGVQVVPLPYYAGVRATPLGLMKLRRALRKIGIPDDVFIGRVPEPTSLELLRRARALGARSMAILVIDPQELRSLLPSPIGPLFAAILTRLAKKAIRGAHAVSYVSERHFQMQYPADLGTPALGRSDVILPEGWLRSSPRQDRGPDSLRLVSIGTLEHPAKGMDVLLDAVEHFRDRGVSVILTIIGEGRLRPALEASARARDLPVTFTGQITDKSRLGALLEEADVYVSASRAEGLPRATVEAMAKALPVVTTAAGAAAELVEPPFLTPIDDLAALCGAIQRLHDDRDEYQRQSQASLKVAARVEAGAQPELLIAFLREHLGGANTLDSGGE